MKKNEATYSEEVQDIIDRMPTYWCWWVSCVMLSVVMMLVAAGFVIKYPDTVSGSIVVRETKPSIRIMSPSSGRLRLLQDNYAAVKAGDALAYIESGASYSDIIILDSICHCVLRKEIVWFLPEKLVVGELSNSYQNLVMSYQNYDMLRNTHLYDNMRCSLVSQIETDARKAAILQRKRGIQSELVGYNEKRALNDSILCDADAISCEQLENQRILLMEQQLSELDINNAHSSCMSDINKSKIELARVDIDEQEKLQMAYNSLQQAFVDLANALELWKEHYLISAPVDGHIEYLGFWKQDAFVAIAKELFSILPDENEHVGEMLVSAVGVGKVHEGQSVNVKIHNYPYKEFGFVKGKVASVSQLASVTSQDENGMMAYRVNITFPHKMLTNYGMKLDIGHEALGQADIVVRKRRLIQRLFDNLKSKENK